MRLFQKKFVPKKLSIKEMGRLYRTLKYGLGGDINEFLIDEIIYIVGHISVDELNESLRIMYSGNINYSDKTPIDLALLFTDGIVSSGIIQFSDFIRTMKSGR